MALVIHPLYSNDSVIDAINLVYFDQYSEDDAGYVLTDIPEFISSAFEEVSSLTRLVREEGELENYDSE